MKTIPNLIAVLGLLIVLGVFAGSCSEEAAFKVPPAADVDFGRDVSDGETLNCALEPVSCSSDEDCSVCGQDWSCCNGYCMQQCLDGDTDKPADAEYDCPALGKECSTWMDCYLYCPTDDRPYACLGGVCVYADETEAEADGDAETAPELEPEPEAELPDQAFEAEDATLDTPEELIPETEEVVPEAEEDTIEIEQDTLDTYCYPTGENRAPMILTSYDLQQIFVGDLMMLELKAQDPDPCDELSCECVQCPEGVRISLLDGTPGSDYAWQIIWQPTEADVGRHELNIKVSDNAPTPLYATTVIPVEVLMPHTNHAPQYDQIADRELLVGDRLEFAFRVWDEDGDPITLVEIDVPQQIALTYNDAEGRVEVTVDASAMDQPRLLRAVFELRDNQGGATRGELKVNVLPRARANDCNGAIRLFLHDRYYGTTEDRSNENSVGAPCIEYPQPGPDMFFRLKRDPGQHLHVWVEPLNSDFDLAVHLWNPECARCLSGEDTHLDGEAELLLLGEVQPDYPEITIVVDSYNDRKRGPFMLTVEPTTVQVGTAPICASCEDNLDCGYFANCVEVVFDDVVIERTCGKNCNDSDNCPRGYECREVLLVNGGYAKQCRPAYYRTGPTGYDVLTCSAFTDLGKACQDTNTQQDEAECGADEAGIVVDDADCATFDLDGQEQSICTVRCSHDDSCPEGFYCAWQQWYGYCLPED